MCQLNHPYAAVIQSRPISWGVMGYTSTPAPWAAGMGVASNMVLKSSTMSWMLVGDGMGLPNACCCQSSRAMACLTKHSLAEVIPMDRIRFASMDMLSAMMPPDMHSQSVVVRYGQKSKTFWPEHVRRRCEPVMVFKDSMAATRLGLTSACMVLAL